MSIISNTKDKTWNKIKINKTKQKYKKKEKKKKRINKIPK